MIKGFFFCWLLALWCPTALTGQVVTSSPPFPTVGDSIVVFFHAREGNGGLRGYTRAVYAHTGVITDRSSGSTDWRYVVAAWNVNRPKAKLTRIGVDLWRLAIGRVRAFYGVPATEKVLKLAFVFRSADGSHTGRDTGGADIFLPLFEPGITLLLEAPEVSVPFGDPARSPVFLSPNDTLQIRARAIAVGTRTAGMTLLEEGRVLARTTADTLRYAFAPGIPAIGMHRFAVVARDTAGRVDTTRFAAMVNPPVPGLAAPAGVADGPNELSDTRATLALYAPFKKFVYVLGDFNDWKVDTAYYMNRQEIRSDSVRFWLTIDGLEPGREYAYQYFVDGEIRIADPYAEKVLDPWNDQFIDSATYPNLKPYPEGNTAEIVSVLQTAQEPFPWQTTDFQRPALQDLVIYELLVRDFVAAHNYRTLIDTLDYLVRLGINAVELMPVNEFDGNSSWGYNPAFYFAPDKYYGPKNDLKQFVDACHARGLAVILDMVLNHSTGQSPLVRLYSTGNYGPPSAENPWFNEFSPNQTFRFFEDMDHDSPATRAFVDRVNRFWLQEYRIDGFRFDFTKGFTNRPGDGFAYDASRIAILKRMAAQIWAKHPDTYVILEHFAENREEIELSDAGMMLWGNMNTPYSQSAMGWLEDDQRSSDLSWGFYKTRGWRQPLLVTYMESHDEPWLMFKNLQFGRSSGSYDVKNLDVALNRIKLDATFFLTLPGPKMLWQFGELGYDQELPGGGARTAPKPIRWDYFQQANRNRLYRFIAALLKLRRENELFRSPQTAVTLRVGQGQYDRRLNLTSPDLRATVIGNFHVVPRSVTPNFQHSGTWYDYFSGDSLTISNPTAPLRLTPGEFHIYTDRRLPPPAPGLITAIAETAGRRPRAFRLYQNYPNPFNPATAIQFDLPADGKVRADIFDLLGRKVRTLYQGVLPAGTHLLRWDGRDSAGKELASGVFVIRLTAGAFSKAVKIVKVK